MSEDLSAPYSCPKCKSSLVKFASETHKNNVDVRGAICAKCGTPVTLKTPGSQFADLMGDNIVSRSLRKTGLTLK